MNERKRVLVVDDIPLMRSLLAKHIKRIGKTILESGVEVIEAESGSEALEHLKSGGIDLVFLDLMMPQMDGLTFLAAKKKDPAIADTPVIVCSALGEPGTVEKASDLGAADYIVKPFSVEAIEETVSKALLVPEV